MQCAIHTRIAPINSSIRRNNDCTLRGLAQFAVQRARAIEHYVAFVHEGTRAPSVWNQLQGQIYLGPLAFIDKMQALVDKKPSLTEILRAQRRVAKRALAEFASAHERNEAIALAYLSGQHTMSAIAAHFGVHYTTVSRFNVDWPVVFEPPAKCVAPRFRRSLLKKPRRQPQLFVTFVLNFAA